MRMKTLFPYTVALSMAISLPWFSPALTFGAEGGDVEDAGPMLDAQELAGLTAEASEVKGEQCVKTVFAPQLSMGYRAVVRNDDGYRIFPYSDLTPDIAASGTFTYLKKDFSLDIAANRQTDREYEGSLAMNFAGRYRFLYLRDVLFHALTPERFLWSAPLVNSAGNTIYYDPAPDATDHAGIKVSQDRVTLRLKPTDYPFHIDLGFRSYLQEGTRQLRFSDVRNGSIANNTVYNRKRTVDQGIYEGIIGADANFGYVDLCNHFQIRHFSDQQGIPRMVSFLPRESDGLVLREGGRLQHNENPDSRFWANTTRLHTSISSGLVGAISYTYGQRLSFSKLTDISGAAEAVTTLQNLAGDITYVPRPDFSFSIKYRRQITEHELPDAVVRLPAGGGPLPAGVQLPTQDSVDTRHDSLMASILYRPRPFLLLKGEFKGDFMRRQADLDPVPTWLAYHHEDRYQGRGVLIATPVRGMRFKGEYGYVTVTHPLYGTAYDERQYGELQFSYNRSNTHGTSLAVREARETGGDLRRDQRMMTASAWFSPISHLVLTAHYGYQRDDTDEMIVFRDDAVAVYRGGGEFLSRSRLLGLNALVTVSEDAGLSLGYQRVSSNSRFTPPVLPTLTLVGTDGVVTTFDTAGIGELSRTEGVESEVSGRLDYRLSHGVQTSVEYLYRQIRDRVDPSLNGAAHQVMAKLAYRW